VISEIHAFKYVNILDKAEKNVLGVQCSINIRIDNYSDEEILNLDSSYKSMLINNTISQFEIIHTAYIDSRKLQTNQIYTINVYDKKTGATTSFQGLVLKLERTHKIDGRTNRYFYTGARFGEDGYDGLFIFNNYLPKVFIAVHKTENKAFVIKSFSNKSEAKILNDSKYFDYNFYDVSEHSKTYSKNLNDGVPHGIRPANAY
jgi:hypothetical protein